MPHCNDSVCLADFVAVRAAESRETEDAVWNFAVQTMLSPQLREVLDCWPDAAGEVQVTAVAPGFSGAGVVRITSANGVWCLRRWPSGPSRLPEDRIRELHRWLAFLKVAGVSTVAVPSISHSGSTLVSAHGSHWQLEPWLPGVADFQQRPTDVRLSNAAAELAKLHLASERYSPKDDGAAWFSSGAGVSPAVIERRVKLRQWAASDRLGASAMANASQRELAGELQKVLSTLVPRIATELEQFADIQVRLQPCLRDVWHDHILFTGNEVTGIVDLSAARTESVAADLSRLLGSLVGDAGDRWDTALDAYSAVRPLSSDERRLIPVLDRSGVVLSSAYWFERMSEAALEEREWQRVQSFAQRVFAMHSDRDSTHRGDQSVTRRSNLE